MRMSRGASARYEKPRAARSSCGLLTPRSNSTPMRFPSPSFATIRAMSSNPPRTTRARCPYGSSRARAAATASPSRSMPRTETSGRASRRRRACPPPPTVPSTTSPAGTAASSSSTSRAITGWCANASVDPRVIPESRLSSTVMRRTQLQPPGRATAVRLSLRIDSVEAGGVGASPRHPGGWSQVHCKLVSSPPRVGPRVRADRVRPIPNLKSRTSNPKPAPTGLVQRRPAGRLVLAPPLGVPDLDAGEDPGDHRLPREARVLPQRQRERDPALPVRGDLAGVGEEDPGRVEVVLALTHLLEDLLRHPRELLLRVHGEAAAGNRAAHGPLGQCRTDP